MLKNSDDSAPISLRITLKYSCVLCGLRGVTVDVLARASESVPVVKWLEGTTLEIAKDHTARSPGCPARSLQDLMIPMDGAIYIGGAAVH
jgi:hypothetical protein